MRGASPESSFGALIAYQLFVLIALARNRLGADLHLVNQHGKTAVDYAKQGGANSLRVYNQIVAQMRHLVGKLLFVLGFESVTKLIVEYVY